MTDLRTLTDAFAELERRADATSAGMLPELRPRRALGARLAPVAATVAVVAGLAAGAALLAPGDSPSTRDGAPPAAGGSTMVPPASPSAPPSVIPRTPQDLAARFRAVLGDTATFTVTDTGGAAVMTLPPPAPTTTGRPSPAR